MRRLRGPNVLRLPRLRAGLPWRRVVPDWLSFRRVVLTLVLGAAGSMGAYAFAASSSLFDVEAIRISGVDGDLAREVRVALKPLVGTSLVRLDTDRARLLARKVPRVRAVSVERDFPGTLEVRVVPERPVAVVRSGASSAWLVSAAGRVLRPIDLASPPADMPRIWLPAGAELEPGEVVRDSRVLLPAQALGRLPEPFPLPIVVAAAEPGGVVLRLRGNRDLRLLLGPADDVRLKLAVAAQVLDRLVGDGGKRFDYLDVSVPDRPVAGCEGCRKVRVKRPADDAPGEPGGNEVPTLSGEVEAEASSDNPKVDT